eukprot:12899444-Prorocentrum_lima.AAC.1
MRQGGCAVLCAYHMVIGTVLRPSEYPVYDTPGLPLDLPSSFPPPLLWFCGTASGTLHWLTIWS